MFHIPLSKTDLHHLVINLCTYLLFLISLVCFYFRYVPFLLLQNSPVETITHSSPEAYTEPFVLLTLLLLLMVFLHVRIGIENILNDYVHSTYSRKHILCALDFFLSSLFLSALLVSINIVYFCQKNLL